MFKNSITYFIAKRISSRSSHESGGIMVHMATISIAISVAVMIISLFVVMGFKNEITSKVTGFAAHFTITSLSGRDKLPLSKDAEYVEIIANQPFVESIVPITTKAGMIKSSDAGVYGVALKGVGSDYDLRFLEESLIEGRFPDFSLDKTTKEILVSQTIANKMMLSLDDKIEMMFISDERVFRDRLEVVGIYETSLAEFDGVTIIGDIRVANRVSGFGENQVGSFEVVIDDFNNIEDYHYELEDIVFDTAAKGEQAMVSSITETYITIFDWLALQDINIIIILVIMVFVSAFSMTAMVLIMIINKSSMIGMLSVMGMKKAQMQRLFLWHSAYIVAKGVVIGAVVALALALLQREFQIITLSSDAYFIDYVPVQINYIYLCAVMGYSFVALLLMQSIPVRMVTKMSPHSSIKFS